MARRPPVRDDLRALEGYHSPQVDVRVRLNTNESPEPPPAAWRDALAAELSRVAWHRYPDRAALALREAIAALHGVDASMIFAANGSNEVLQAVLLAYGGPGRTVATFEPTYQLHGHIARLTGTAVAEGERTPNFELDPTEVDRVFREAGFAWGESGCSMCAGGNGDRGESGERIVSTTNRNFENRQGPGVRTHLASPATAAATAIAGRIADVRQLLAGHR